MGRTKFEELPATGIYTTGLDDLLIAYGIACRVRLEMWNIGLYKAPPPKRVPRSLEDWITDTVFEGEDRGERTEPVEEESWSGQ